MADTFKKLAQGQLPTSAATIYTAATAAIIKAIRIVNNTGAAVTFTLYQSGTAAANAITHQITLAAGSTFVTEEVLTLAAADTIAGVAGTATALTYTISGMEV